MSGPGLAGLLFGAMLLLIAVRLPIGLAMFLAGSAGYVLLAGWTPYLAYIKTTPYYLFSNYTLSVIPLFVLMGAFAEQGGLSQRLFAAADALLLEDLPVFVGLGPLTAQRFALGLVGNALELLFERFRLDDLG